MKKDATRITVEKTLANIKRVKTRMSKLYEFGPDKVKLVRREARTLVQNMGQDERNNLFGTLGKDKWDAMMRDMYNG